MLCLLATHLNCFLVLFGRISAVRSSPILSHYPGILCYVMSQSGKKKKRKKKHSADGVVTSWRAYWKMF